MKKRTMYILITWLVGWIGCGGFLYAIIKNIAESAGIIFGGIPLTLYHLIWIGIASYLSYYFKTNYTEDGVRINRTQEPPRYQPAPAERVKSETPSPIRQDTPTGFCKVTVHGIDPASVRNLENIPFRSTFAPPSPQPVPGYRFVGWYYDSSFTRDFLPTDPITGNIDLFAKYIPHDTPATTTNTTSEPPSESNQGKRVTVKFIHSFSEDLDTLVFKRINLYENDIIPSLDEEPQIPDCRFEGWYLDKDFQTPFVPGQTRANSEMKLYAKFKNEQDERIDYGKIFRSITICMFVLFFIFFILYGIFS